MLSGYVARAFRIVSARTFRGSTRASSSEVDTVVVGVDLLAGIESCVLVSFELVPFRISLHLLERF